MILSLESRLDTHYITLAVYHYVRLSPALTILPVRVEDYGKYQERKLKATTGVAICASGSLSARIPTTKVQVEFLYFKVPVIIIIREPKISKNNLASRTSGILLSSFISIVKVGLVAFDTIIVVISLSN
ncbi:hypothetical protein BDQ17DRAFT_1340079, partial [Cyathus striatus]